MTIEALAFDKSLRSYDAFDRLHVSLSNVTKATVNPYIGHEIPNWQGLGLDPNRVYFMFRDPAELEKAVPTFNNIPILSKHVKVTPEEPHKELVIGSTGTDAVWVAPYLKNSLVFWDNPAIGGIETKDVRELSSSYRYDAVMQPGVYQGLRFDGFMRNIVANHVCLVEDGRAGSDVIVGDSQPEGLKMALKSKTGLMLQGALAALVAPRLAQGMAFDAAPLLTGVRRVNYVRATKDLPELVLRAVDGKLAADQALDPSELAAVIKAVKDNMPLAADADMIEEKVAKDAFPDKDGVAEDEDDDPDGADDEDDDKDKPAMDANTVAKMISDANAKGRKAMGDMLQAVKDVRPFIGDVDTLGMDSAGDVYKLALEANKIDLTGVHASAYPAMLKMLPKPGAQPVARNTLAMDAKSVGNFHTMFPTASKLKVAV